MLSLRERYSYLAEMSQRMQLVFIIPVTAPLNGSAFHGIKEKPLIYDAVCRYGTISSPCHVRQWWQRVVPWCLGRRHCSTHHVVKMRALAFQSLPSHSSDCTGIPGNVLLTTPLTLLEGRGVSQWLSQTLEMFQVFSWAVIVVVPVFQQLIHVPSCQQQFWYANCPVTYSGVCSITSPATVLMF